MRLQYVLKDIGIGLRRNLTMTVALVVVTTVSLSLLGVGLLMREQVALTKGYWYDRVEISVFLCNEFDTGANCADGQASKEQKATIRQTLEDSPEVQRVYFETQAQAYQRFKQRFNADLADNITPDQLQESFRIKLDNPEEYEGVVSAVSGLPGVFEVSDQRSTLGPIFDIINRLQWATWAASVALLTAALLLTGILIRVAAFNRRRETSIMRLVGAASFYIQLPFILEAVVASLIGAALACGLLAAFEIMVVQGQLERLRFTEWVGWQQVLSIYPWLFAAGVGLAVVAAFVTLRRYLRV